jgi:glycosyltransferase involved in cell wall biosynthesis
MRILYFYQYFTTPKGAWGTRVYEFARRWAKAGDRVTVITSVYDKSDLKPEGLISRFNVDGIDVRVINIRLSNKHGKAVRVFTFAVYALMSCWYALVLPADVVVSSSGPITVGLPGLVAHYIRRRPLVFEVRDLWPEGSIQIGMVRNKLVIRLARFFERLCYRASTTVVALSEGMADWIRQRYGIENIEVVPNASDNELVASVNGSLKMPAWSKNKKLVLYTGTLGLQDDCGQILEVAKILELRGARNLEIVVIGDGKERAMLEKKKDELKLSNVQFLGLISKEDVMRWLKLACCSLFVVKDLPYLATASPNKLFDAFAAGVPVIQTTQGWIKDLLERERCGITVPPQNAEAMATAVLELTTDNTLQRILGNNCRRVAKELFDRELLAKKMRRILADAADQRDER